MLDVDFQVSHGKEINNKMSIFQATVEFDSNQESSDSDLSETMLVSNREIPAYVLFPRFIEEWMSHWQTTIGSPNTAEMYRRPNRGNRPGFKALRGTAHTYPDSMGVPPPAFRLVLNRKALQFIMLLMWKKLYMLQELWSDTVHLTAQILSQQREIITS